jgi:hypothetical protein
MYFTTDFEAAKGSVQMLANLEPELAVTGHGRAMQGQECGPRYIYSPRILFITRCRKTVAA